MRVRSVLVAGRPVDVDLLVEVAVGEGVNGIQLAGLEVEFGRKSHQKTE